MTTAKKSSPKKPVDSTEEKSTDKPIHSKKNKSVLFILILIIIAAVVIFTKKKPQTVSVVPPATQNAPTQTTVSLAQEVQKESIEDKGDGYTIDVHYPRAQSEAVTKYMSDYANDAITEFKNDTSWLSDPSVPKSAGSASLSIDYTSVSTATTITYVFTNASYTGGAHDITSTSTFNFDKASGEFYTVKNIFNDESAGLKTISDYSIAALKKKNISDDDWIGDGAGPTEDNYQAVAFTPAGLEVFFDPYQVAAYAAGPQTVTVPYSVLKGKLIAGLSTIQ